MSETPLAMPWVRGRPPTPFPSVVTDQALLDLPKGDFQRLIRDHLLPRPESRAEWVQMWDHIFISELLTDRTLDTLEDFLGAVTDLLANPNSAEGEIRKARRFERQVNEAWARVVAQGDLRPPAALRRLATAVARHHRQAAAAGDLRWFDQELWSTMTVLKLTGRPTDD